MNKESKEALQKLSKDKELSFKLEGLYESNPERFTENSLKFLNENGIELAKEDLKEIQEISLEELEQIAGGSLSSDLIALCGKSAFSFFRTIV